VVKRATRNTRGYRLWVGGPVPPGADGITIGQTVIVRKQVTHSHTFDHLLRHELTHVEQYRDLGTVRFLSRYVGEYLAGRRAGKSHRQAYLDISFEQEARLRADHPIPQPSDCTLAEVEAAHQALETWLSELPPGKTDDRLQGLIGHSPAPRNDVPDFLQRLSAYDRSVETNPDLQPDDWQHRLQQVLLTGHRIGCPPLRVLRWPAPFVDRALAGQLGQAAQWLDRPLHVVDEFGVHHTVTPQAANAAHYHWAGACLFPAERLTRRALLLRLLERSEVPA
jgi:hypothetical protein